MKGDFSRDTFDSKKHYSRVLMQQGRVQTDADWNEQQAITAHREQTETKDVIGWCGAPLHDPGFHIVASADDLYDEEKKLPGNQDPPKLQTGDFLISAGRFYVDGILCQNEQIVPFTNQIDFPNVQNALDLLKDTKLGIVYLDVWQRHLTALDDDYIREKALGGPDTATRAKAVWQVKVLPVKGGARNASACNSDFAEWDSLVAPSSGMLNAYTTLPPSDDVCLVPPSAGYQRLENQLYRVEIHQGGNFPNDPVAFKWSRDNGTVVTSITNISGQDISVHDVGPDDVLGFANGQWAEVSDDSLELNGRPGELIQIQNVNAATKTITLQSAPTLAFKKEFHPKLRRWDGAGEVKIDGTWQALEGGIEVQCSDGTYKTGDYWLIPARTATGEIEWPPFETPNLNPIALPPRGIQHHYCRLALLAFDTKTLSVQQDCRDIFYPLAANALHVTKTSWQNDDLLSTEALQKGLQIWFDLVPDKLSLVGGGQPSASPTVIVSVEAPIQSGTAAPDSTFILDSKISLQSDSILLQIVEDPKLFDELIQQQALVRVRVTLKGHTIFSHRGADIVYLDGQAFGKAGVRADGKTPRIDLNLPSGSGARASDFESWFYLGAVETKAPLQVTDVKLVMAASGTSFDIVPQQSAHQPPAQIPELLGEVEVTFNRAPGPKSVTANSVFVFTMDGAAKFRVTPKSLTVSGSTVTLRLADAISLGVLEVAGGVDNSFTPPTTPVTQDDGTPLDGDYDNAAGGDFLLPFSQIG